jgi:phosphomevalonate kinase
VTPSVFSGGGPAKLAAPRVAAPGKVLLTGAYAVLEGAPALVVAVDRYAHVDPSRPAAEPTREVAAALGEKAPYFDASALYHEGTKLGLGSSAAVLVASLGAEAASKGADLSDPDVRSKIFWRARDTHVRVQGGGSGVDVAASTYGGVLRYTLHGGKPWILHSQLPDDLVLSIWFSGASARTSDLLAQVEELRAKDAESHRRHMSDLGLAAEIAAEKFEGGSLREFIVAARAFGASLDRLGEAADANIVPLAFKRLAVAAEEEGAAFLPSGAGGGDVGVFLGASKPTEAFAKRAASLGMQALEIGVDRRGLRVTALDTN